jgi:excisionase family DNA binding protein
VNPDESDPTGPDRARIRASDLLTIKQAGEEYAPALGRRYVRRLVSEKRIPFYRIGGRVFVAKCDLDTLTAASRIEAERA